MTTAAPPATTIKPVWAAGRATVVESPLDEEQTPTGLIVKHSYVDGDGLMRGVLIDVVFAPGWEAPLEAGMIVYYSRAQKVRIGSDVLIVALDDVFAYEA